MIGRQVRGVGPRMRRGLVTMGTFGAAGGRTRVSGRVGPGFSGHVRGYPAPRHDAASSSLPADAGRAGSASHMWARSSPTPAAGGLGGPVALEAESLHSDSALGGRPRTSAPVREPAAAAWPLSAPARCFKRALDIVIATLALLIVLPALSLAAIAIKLDSRGPVLFTQWRSGVRGRRFRIYKLRTMAVDNDDTLHRAYVAALIRGEAGRQDGMFKLVSDPRVTRVGRVLRRLSIDEVPQLWNVLIGEMSLVGPRPPLPAEVELYDDRALQRLEAKPGITGLPQVRGRCELTFAESVDLDLEYLRSWSVWLELKILLLTPLAVVSKKGAA